MLKKLVLFLALAITVFATWKCSKSDSGGCTSVLPQAEDAAMQQYMTTAGITGTKDPSGLYYQIIDPGTGSAPTINSRVYVKYAGKLTNNTQFDAQTDPLQTGWALSGLIQGWQIGIPKIKRGGKIKLVVPSSLGYGCKAITGIPANSILVFDVELVDFN
ncbi:FKBP-type peptidyl-prolyl cis-trans isomerase [Flavihumibacter profundi]|uniref:FKBP-type peptidyl-prolyl cis-trans isomerase n=1 Tax=Flavihumibacter profundi TaxID=2716883 RepID=UPI001CC6223D|nr:FKBP-type peptidyl-prolyl cis-trans isomerase [Flavihumibacter profundi]MBZ5855784.1 FKBP-type peptidyl-prolyl cis-trans isomerase [Flavihumibacter profundi]